MFLNIHYLRNIFKKLLYSLWTKIKFIIFLTQLNIYLNAKLNICREKLHLRIYGHN